MKGETMSQRTRQFFEALKEGAAEAAQEIGAELKQLANHGRTELAAALFNQSPFVMYMRETHTTEQTPDHGLPPEAMKQQEMQQEQERGGREM
jgi:hypothetical protein